MGQRQLTQRRGSQTVGLRPGPSDSPSFASAVFSEQKGLAWETVLKQAADAVRNMSKARRQIRPRRGTGDGATPWQCMQERESARRRRPGDQSAGTYRQTSSPLDVMVGGMGDMNRRPSVISSHYSPRPRPARLSPRCCIMPTRSRLGSDASLMVPEVRSARALIPSVVSP